MYIGSLELDRREMWLVDSEGKMKLKEVSYSPGLLKIFGKSPDLTL